MSSNSEQTAQSSSWNSVADGSPIEITLKKEDGGGLGFNIVGGIDDEHIPGQSGIFVSRIREGTPTAKDGRLKIGDRILSVNDIDLSQKTHDEAVGILRQVQGVCILVVEPNAEEILLSKPTPVLVTPTATSPLTQKQKALKSILKEKQDSVATTPTENGMAAKVALKTGDGLPAASERFSVSYAAENESSPLPSPSTSRHSSFRGSVVDSPQSAAHIRRNRSVSSGSTAITGTPTTATALHSSALAEDADEDKMSVHSLAPSTYSVADDLPRTPKRPFSILDPANPSILTEALFVSIGVVALGVTIYFSYRYFKRR
jgi:hypothetical protein